MFDYMYVGVCFRFPSASDEARLLPEAALHGHLSIESRALTIVEVRTRSHVRAVAGNEITPSKLVSANVAPSLWSN